jgi:hypothetical protein
VNIWFFNASVVFYALGTLRYFLFVVLLRELLAKTALFAVSTGFALHRIAFLLRYIEAGHTPVANLHESLSFFAWGIGKGILHDPLAFLKHPDVDVDTDACVDTVQKIFRLEVGAGEGENQDEDEGN